jgi:hypothetical protein
MQFFKFARFEPQQPKVDEATYRALIRRVVARNPRSNLPDSERIVIPGYSNLRDFSREHETELKSECGGAHQSYFQRGNWRLIFPFTRKQQAQVAKRLLEGLKTHTPLVAHVLRFPQLTINHALMVYDAQETEKEILFAAYDPNQPAKPRVITYDRATRTFSMPRNNYFLGGRVDVYRIYHRWDY